MPPLLPNFWPAASSSSGAYVKRLRAVQVLSLLTHGDIDDLKIHPLVIIDPYHTYLTLAALSICPAPSADASWELPKLNVAWNATEDTAQWVRDHVPASVSAPEALQTQYRRV